MKHFFYLSIFIFLSFSIQVTTCCDKYLMAYEKIQYDFLNYNINVHHEFIFINTFSSQILLNNFDTISSNDYKKIVHSSKKRDVQLKFDKEFNKCLDTSFKKHERPNFVIKFSKIYNDTLLFQTSNIIANNSLRETNESLVGIFIFNKFGEIEKYKIDTLINR